MKTFALPILLPFVVCRSHTNELNGLFVLLETFSHKSLTKLNIANNSDVYSIPKNLFDDYVDIRHQFSICLN